MKSCERFHVEPVSRSSNNAGLHYVEADCFILRRRGQPIPVICSYLEELLHRFGRDGGCRLMWVKLLGKFPEKRVQLGDLVIKAKVTGTVELLRSACLTLPGTIIAAKAGSIKVA